MDQFIQKILNMLLKREIKNLKREVEIINRIFSDRQIKVQKVPQLKEKILKD